MCVFTTIDRNIGAVKVVAAIFLSGGKLFSKKASSPAAVKQLNKKKYYAADSFEATAINQ